MKPLREEWKQTHQSPYFRYDPHWNKNGHKIAAQAIAQYLKDEKILPKKNFKDSGTEPPLAES